MPWDSMQMIILILHPMRMYTPHLCQYVNALVRKYMVHGFHQIMYLIKCREFL